MSGINPTPQESFSSAGSNRPKPDASIVHALLAGPKAFRSGVPTQPPCAPPLFAPQGKRGGKGLRPRGDLLVLEATFVPLAPAALVAFLPPSGAPSPTSG